MGSLYPLRPFFVVIGGYAGQCDSGLLFLCWQVWDLVWVYLLFLCWQVWDLVWVFSLIQVFVISLLAGMGPGMGIPPGMPLPDFSRPPPGFPMMPPPVVNEADLMPSVPYFELPAGLMAPLVKVLTNDFFSYNHLLSENATKFNIFILLKGI